MLLFKEIENTILKRNFLLYKSKENLLLHFFLALLFYYNILEFEYTELEERDDILIEMLLTIFDETKIEKTLKEIYNNFFLTKKMLLTIGQEELILQWLVKEENTFFKTKLLSKPILYSFIEEHINKTKI